MKYEIWMKTDRLGWRPIATKRYGDSIDAARKDIERFKKDVPCEYGIRTIKKKYWNMSQSESLYGLGEDLEPDAWA